MCKCDVCTNSVHFKDTPDDVCLEQEKGSIYDQLYSMTRYLSNETANEIDIICEHVDDIDSEIHELIKNIKHLTKDEIKWELQKISQKLY